MSSSKGETPGKKAKTRKINGKLQWFDPTNQLWRAAVYHDDIRDELIAENNERGIYRYGRQSGLKTNDITCFHNFKGQQNWGIARNQWPDILYQYESKGETRTSRKAEPWLREGRIVLDVNDDPVLAFKELPATISSKCEPAFLEAYTRLNEQIKLKDIRARMPRHTGGKVKADGDDSIRIGTLSMSMTRFRNKAGMITWNSRAGSTPIKEYLDTLLPAECKAQNSIKGFRNLYEHEVLMMKIFNIGCYPEKARRGRDRTPSAAKRNKARDALTEKYKIAYEKFAKAQGNIVEHANAHSHDYANMHGREDANYECLEDDNNDDYENGNKDGNDDGGNDDGGNDDGGNDDGGNNDGGKDDGGNNDGNGHDHDDNAKDDHNDDDRNDQNNYDLPQDDDNDSTNHDDDSLSITLSDEHEGAEDAGGISDDVNEVGDGVPTNEEAVASSQDVARISIYMDNPSRYDLHDCVQAEVAANSGPKSTIVSPTGRPVTVSSQSTVYLYRGIGHLNCELTRYLVRTSREVVGLDRIHNYLLQPAREACCQWTGASEGPRLRPEDNYFANFRSIQQHLNLYRVSYRLPLVQLPGFVRDQDYTAHWEDGFYCFPQWHQIVRLAGFPVSTLQVAIS